MSELTLLGSAGWMPTNVRETCCAFQRQGSRGLLIDCGTGARRLVQDPNTMAGLERLDVVLTHFHLDHLAGLAYLPLADLPPEVIVSGPGRSLYGTETAGLIDRLIGEPFLAPAFAEIATEVAEIGPGTLELGPFTLEARQQDRHSHPTLAFRSEDHWTYCTDTAHDPDNAAFARGSRVLFHDAWCTSDNPRDLGGHATAGQAGELAKAAGVEQLVLIHTHPLNHDDETLRREARAEFETSEVGRDGTQF